MYGLEGSVPIERDIQILNARWRASRRPPIRCGTKTRGGGVVVDDAATPTSR
jgi:hypothetical protein